MFHCGKQPLNISVRSQRFPDSLSHRLCDILSFCYSSKDLQSELPLHSTEMGSEIGNYSRMASHSPSNDHRTSATSSLSQFTAMEKPDSPSKTSVSVRCHNNELVQLNHHQIQNMLQFFELSARRERRMSAASSSQQQGGNDTDFTKLLEEKEKDLELAAKIGQSLLEQNRELQNRNDFLEESLNASNETVVQLRHELQMRINLLHVYADYDDYNEACGSRERRSTVEHLQRRMKKLETENITLRNETTNLRKHSAGVEERERLHITECAKQLDATNEKILRLQSLIAEKNEEVAMQSAEVERLLQEVTARESHEKALKDENLDLHEQLNDALAQHEQMTADFLELQERYTEVMSMLHDTEEELRTFRQNQKSHRAASSDSLYDSLASELEASDSGFYSTMSSARSESGGEYGRTDVKRLHIELERIRCKEPNEPLMEAPSVERVAVVSETRSVAVSTDHLQQPMLTSATAQTSPDGRLRQPSHCSDDVVDVPSPLLAELVRSTRAIQRPRIPSSPSPTPLENAQPECSEDKDFDFKIQIDEPTPTETSAPTTFTQSAELVEESTEKQKHSTALVETHIQEIQRRLSDVSADEANNSHHVWSPRDGMRRLGHRNSTSSSTSGDTLSKTPSSDSLAGYEGPKMGEPGKPGTRDLDFSIRRLNLRKQVEREYARFRRERGLSPLCIPFFPPPIPKKKRASAMLRSQSMQQSNDFLNRVVPKHRPNLLKPWHIFSNVGLLAAIRDTVSQGVLTRSTILHNPPMTPPSTPLIYRRYTNGTAVRLQQRLAPRSATSLVDALGLSVPLQMPIVSDRTNNNNNYSAFRTITKLSDFNEANNNNSNTSIKSAPS